ncbi:hypothetical protein MP638_007419 [Amoeboaphelidium occidentale]|nr:hypothetical protein MP638_007419 [Amoeboaphelidium occidentale]
MSQHDNENKNMQQTIIEISRAIAAGSIHLEDVASHLSDLISKLNDIVNIAYSAIVIDEARYERLPELAKLYKLLLKEIIGKKRHNYGSFFKILVSSLNYVIVSIVVKDENIEEYLDIFKNCLKWRFVVPSGDWRRLDNGMLINFRTACGKYLFSENVPEYNPHVSAAAEYRRRARLQSLKFGDVITEENN